MEHPQFRHRK